MEWLKKYLIEHPGERILIFAQFVEMGAKPIYEMTRNLGIRSGIIEGGTQTDERTRIVNQYNLRVFNILIISKAGGEGLDLKETNTVILMQPGWNQAELDQATARAIRYKSHSNLPEDDRHVNVYKLILTKPEDRIPGDEDNDAVDEKLEELSERKNERNKSYLDRLRLLSIENNLDC